MHLKIFIVKRLKQNPVESFLMLATGFILQPIVFNIQSCLYPYSNTQKLLKKIFYQLLLNQV